MKYTVVLYYDGYPIGQWIYTTEKEALDKQNELSKLYGYENVRLFVKEVVE